MSASTQTMRLLWKEYRALRTVWLMSVAGVVLINLIAAIQGRMFQAHQFFGVFWALAMVVPAGYAIGVTGMMFAGEREERSLDWLTALAPTSSLLYWVKLTFTLASALVLQLFLVLIAVVFSFADPAFHPLQLADPNLFGFTAVEAVLLALFVLLEVTAWGAFWSLQTSRPATAIFQTALTVIAWYFVMGISFDYARFHRISLNRGVLWSAFDSWGWFRTLCLAGAIFGGWRLNHSWLTGYPWDWGFVAAWWAQRRLRPCTAVVALKLEASEPWRRAWARLWWLEMQSLRTFAAITFAATLLACLSIAISPIITKAGATFEWTIALGWLLILIGGLMSWRGEQAQQQFRFFVNQGVSPIALWANKLLLWFLGTVCAVGVLLATTLPLWEFLSRSTPEIWHPKPLAVPSLSHFWEAVILVIAGGVMEFVVAFVWSLLARKMVVAFGGALMSAVAMVFWILFNNWLGLPQWLFSGGVAIALLLLSVRYLPNWWLERSGLWAWLPRIAELATFVVAVLVGVMVYRVIEVPIPESTPWINPAQPPSTAAVAANVAGWRQVADAVLAIPPGPGHPIQFKADNEWSRWIEDNADGFDQLRAAILVQPVPLPQAAEVFRSYAPIKFLNRVDSVAKPQPPSAPLAREPNWYLAMLGLARRAVVHFDPDHPDQSLQDLRACLRLGGSIQRVETLRNRMLIQSRVYLELAAWANHPQQTADSLQQALRICRQEQRLWQLDVDQLTITEDELLWRGDYSECLPFERWRCRRLVDVACANRVRYWQETQQQDQQPSTSPGRILSRDVLQDAAWTYSPPRKRRNGDDGSVYGLEPFDLDRMHSAIAQYRARVTVMALVGFRRLHGRLPQSLAELAPLVPDADSLFTDPYSGEWFHYEPVGMAAGIDVVPPDSPLRQPLLWSGGLRQLRWKATDKGIAVKGSHSNESGEKLLNPIDPGNNSLGLSIFPIPPIDMDGT